MWLFASLLTALLSLEVTAAIQVNAQIYDIDEAPGEETLLLLTTGHVARLKETSQKSNNFHQLKDNQQWLSITLNERHEIESIEPVARPKSLLKSWALNEPIEQYRPTVIENMDLAHKYFKEARYVSKESQCYNRAHIWSYEWFLNHTVYSNKSWLFFTRKYIRKFKFEWWFHVAPSVQVRDNGVVKEKIMDIKYGRSPIDPKRWTDIFMLNDAHCPLVTTYSDYANYPESGWCFTMRSSMFYYQPFDIEMKETWGSIKGNWYDSEVKAAYLEAFGEEI